MLEEFIQLLRNELEEVRREEAELLRELGEFERFVVEERMFDEPDKYLVHLYRLDGFLAKFVEYHSDLEARLRELSIKAEGKVTPKVEGDGQEKRGLLSRLRRRKVKIEVNVGTSMYTLEYGRRLMERIDQLLWQFRNARYLAKFQDDVLKERTRFLIDEYKTYSLDLAGDIRKYALAAIAHHKLQIERLLEKVVSAMLRAEVSRPVNTRT